MRSPLTVAILASGPSLLQTYPLVNDYHRVLAVNAAATKLHHDWFVAGDSLAYTLPLVRASTGYCSPRNVLSKEVPLLGHHVAWESLPLLAGLYPNGVECCYSTLAAIALAISLDASLIHLYGSDMTGEVDCAGRTYDGSGRDQARWANEGSLLTRLAQEVKNEYCVRILRVLPSGRHFL